MTGMKLEPNVPAMWTPQPSRLSVSGNSGSCDVKAYATSPYPDYQLVCLYAEGSPESVAALVATLKDKNSPKLQIGWGNKLDTAWAKGKWRCVKSSFKELRRTAVAIYPPTMEDYTPEKYASCFLMQDGEEVNPWFLNLFGKRLSSVVNITVQPHWYPALLVAGEQYRLMNGMSCSGCRAWQLIANTEAWQDLIVNMLRTGDLVLQNHSEEE